MTAWIPASAGMTNPQQDAGNCTYKKQNYIILPTPLFPVNKGRPSPFDFAALRSGRASSRTTAATAARVDGSQLQIHVLSGNVASGKIFFFRLSSSEIEQE
jgi:hypothetical protein